MRRNFKYNQCHNNKYHWRNRDRDRHRSRSRSPQRSESNYRSCSSSSSCRRASRNGITWQANTKRALRRPSAWDVPPLGYEHLTTAEYKAMQASGQIPLRLVPNAMPTGESASIATVTRQARRLYVGNIPFNSTDEDMAAFFNEQIRRLHGGKNDGNAVLTCQTNLEKSFAFLELRSMDETTLSISLDGILYRGQPLKIRRPHDYQAVAPGRMVEAREFSGTVLPSMPIASIVPDTPHKIYIGGLPSCLNEDQVKELLVTFGQLRGFNMVKDTHGQSKGYAFCEYLDISVTEQAIAGLHGMQLGERKLIVQRSIAGVRSLVAHEVPVLQVPGFPSDNVMGKATEVLCLLNMVMQDELLDDAEYEDIRKDIMDECIKYGNIISVKIPRPFGESPQPGCGKVYVRYETIDDCKKAVKALSGRRFSGRIVMTSFYDLDKFRRKDFS